MLARLRALFHELRNEIAAARRQPEPPPAGRQVVAVLDDDDEPTYVPAATFRDVEGAEEFRRRLASEGIASVSWPPDVGGVAVGVLSEQDETVNVYLQDWYGVPPDFPEKGACPACERRLAERNDGPGFEWRCLACGQVWGAHGPRLL